MQSLHGQSYKACVLCMKYWETRIQFAVQAIVASALIVRLASQSVGRIPRMHVATVQFTRWHVVVVRQQMYMLEELRRSSATLHHDNHRQQDSCDHSPRRL